MVLAFKVWAVPLWLRISALGQNLKKKEFHLPFTFSLLMLKDMNSPFFSSAKWERQTSTRGLLYRQPSWLFQPVLKGPVTFPSLHSKKNGGINTFSKFLCLCSCSQLKVLDEVERRRALSPALVQPFMRAIMEAQFPAPGRTITVKTFLPGSGTEVSQKNKTKQVYGGFNVSMALKQLFHSFL